MLKVHTTIEEEIFYPAARSAGSRTTCSTRPTSSTHRRQGPDRPDRGDDADDDLYDAKVKVLGEYINHHVDEEHSEMFPKCRRAPGMDLVGLRGEMEARKMSARARGRRRSAASQAANDGKGKSSGILASLFSKA